jgi:hypothetical protein
MWGVVAGLGILLPSLDLSIYIDRRVASLFGIVSPSYLHHHQPSTDRSSTWTAFALAPITSLLADMEQGKKQHKGMKLHRVLREQKARLYIIRRCVVMLLCWSD